jgi:hypothetical protein
MKVGKTGRVAPLETTERVVPVATTRAKISQPVSRQVSSLDDRSAQRTEVPVTTPIVQRDLGYGARYQLHRVDDLLAIHQAKASPVQSQKLTFLGVGEKTVYNPTAPFQVPGLGEVIAARVESRDSETDTETVFFRSVPGATATWSRLEGAATLKLQDPFFAHVDGALLVGGVKTQEREDGSIGYRTEFYRTTDLQNFEPVASGPPGMKDIRVVQLKDGKLGVFTRPQGQAAQALDSPVDDEGQHATRGNVGFTIIDDLSQLTPSRISSAPLISTQPVLEQWWGVNEAKLAADGKLEVLGHMGSYTDGGARHYYPVAFVFDPVTQQASGLKVLVERAELGPGESKRPDLQDVLFSGGLREENGQTALYVGAGDAEVHRVVIEPPFGR